MRHFDEMKTAGHTKVLLIRTYNQVLPEQDEMNTTEKQKSQTNTDQLSNAELSTEGEKKIFNLLTETLLQS